MKKWYSEDWQFKLEVLQVGKENKAEECRLGLEVGVEFVCRFETPTGFCPTSFIKIFPSLEVVRCGGDLHNLGGESTSEMTFTCPDGVVKFRLAGEQIQG